MATKLQDYWTVKEAAELVGVSPSRIRQLLRSKQLSGIRITGRAWLVEKNSLTKRKLFGKARQASTAL